MLFLVIFVEVLVSVSCATFALTCWFITGLARLVRAPLITSKLFLMYASLLVSDDVTSRLSVPRTACDIQLLATTNLCSSCLSTHDAVKLVNIPSGFLRTFHLVAKMLRVVACRWPLTLGLEANGRGIFSGPHPTHFSCEWYNALMTTLAAVVCGKRMCLHTF